MVLLLKLAPMAWRESNSTRSDWAAAAQHAIEILNTAHATPTTLTPETGR